MNRYTAKDLMLDGIRRFINLLIWVRVFISPFLVFAIISFFVWIYSGKTTSGLIAACFILFLGVILSAIITVRIGKKHGFLHFISRVNASPELDDIKR